MRAPAECAIDGDPVHSGKERLGKHSDTEEGLQLPLWKAQCSWWLHQVASDLPVCTLCREWAQGEWPICNMDRLIYCRRHIFPSRSIWSHAAHDYIARELIIFM